MLLRVRADVYAQLVGNMLSLIMRVGSSTRTRMF